MPPCLRMNPGGKRGYREEEIEKKIAPLAAQDAAR